jgi:uncharacterized protein
MRSLSQRFLPCVVAVVLAVLCAAPPAQARVVKSLLEQRTDRVMLQKWDLSCGAAALGTLLRFGRGLEVTEREIAISMMNRTEYVANPNIIRAREGFSLLDMRRYVASRGLVGVGLGAMTFEDLLARAPAIVPVRRHGYNHFVVFRGMLGNRVLLADPSFGARTVTRAQFEDLWRPSGAMGRVAFVVEGATAAASFGGLAPRDEEFLTFN